MREHWRLFWVMSALVVISIPKWGLAESRVFWRCNSQVVSENLSKHITATEFDLDVNQQLLDLQVAELSTDLLGASREVDGQRFDPLPFDGLLHLSFYRYGAARSKKTSYYSLAIWHVDAAGEESAANVELPPDANWGRLELFLDKAGLFTVDLTCRRSRH